MKQRTRKNILRFAGVGVAVFTIAFVAGLAYVIVVAIRTILAD